MLFGNPALGFVQDFVGAWVFTGGPRVKGPGARTPTCACMRLLLSFMY